MNTFNPLVEQNNFSVENLLCDNVALCDTYKMTHHSFEEEGTTADHAYIEARTGGKYNEVTFFGLQYRLLYYFTKPVTVEQVDAMERRAILHGVGDDFNREGWMYIIEKHNGFFPLRIRALREGTRTPHGVVQVTIETTDPVCEWAARYVESQLLNTIWPGSSVAARSKRWADIILPYLEKTGTPEELEFKVVDFGFRGDKGVEAAALDGAAHMIYSQVTDNQIAIKLAMEAYPTDTMPGYSIPACEHSTVCLWGEDRELDFFRNVIKVFGKRKGADGGRYAVSCLIDTYDQDRALKYWGVDLKEELINSSMRLVARPDSGDPVTNVPYVLNRLGEYFGYTINEKGYRMLPDWVRVIQGDGIEEDSLVPILDAIMAAGWSVDNVVFGSGGGLLQKDITRDTHRYAQKASWAVVNGEEREFNKCPKTDPSKASKRGRFSVVRRDGVLTTIRENTMREGEIDLLELVYLDGVVMRIQSFDDVRATARQGV